MVKCSSPLLEYQLQYDIRNTLVRVTKLPLLLTTSTNPFLCLFNLETDRKTLIIKTYLDKLFTLNPFHPEVYSPSDQTTLMLQ